jgi:hypothetical protein
VTAERSKTSEEEHQVVPFRPRGAAPASALALRRPQPTSEPPTPSVEGLAKYEGGEADDDYRHRMLVNLAALAVTIVLAIAGGWLAIKIAEMRKNQDCVLSGRRNCAPVDVKALER